jgi:NIPSNAP
MAVVLQVVSKPNPGSDMAKILELVKEAAVLWRKHGSQVRFWTVAVGEVGNIVFTVNFESFSAYGAAVDKLGADPDFQTWQAKRLKLGGANWVRSNLVTEVPV